MYSKTIKIMGRYFTISYSARGYVTINGNGISVTVEMSPKYKEYFTNSTLRNLEIDRIEREAISKVREAMKNV